MLLFTQPIKSNRQLAEALTRVLQHPEVQHGIFRITDGVTSGRIFIADGMVFVGAELAEGKMGAQAVYRLLSISDGIVGFLQVPFEPLDDSTFVDIRTLLFEFEQCPEIPLAEALTKIVGDSARDFDTPAAAIQPEGQSMAGLMADAIHKQVQKELGKKAADTADGDKEQLLLEHLNYYNKLLSQLDRAPYASWLSRAELLNSDLVVYECLLEGDERTSEAAEAMNRLRETLKKAITRAAETAALLADVDTGYSSTSELFKPTAAPQAPPKISHQVDPIVKAAPSDKPAKPEDLLAGAPSSAPPPVSAANRVDKIAVPASSAKPPASESSKPGTSASSAASGASASATNSPASASGSGASSSPSSTLSSAPPPVPAANRSERIAMPASSAAAKAEATRAPKPPGDAPKPGGTDSAAPAQPEKPADAAKSSEPQKPAATPPASVPPPRAAEENKESLSDAWQKAMSEAQPGDSQLTSELSKPGATPPPMNTATEEFAAFDESSLGDAALTAEPSSAEETQPDSAPLLMQLTSLAANTRETKKPSLLALGEAATEDDPSQTVQTAAIKESDLLARRQSMQEAARAPNTVPAGTEPAKPAAATTGSTAKPASQGSANKPSSPTPIAAANKPSSSSPVPEKEAGRPANAPSAAERKDAPGAEKKDAAPPAPTQPDKKESQPAAATDQETKSGPTAPPLPAKEPKGLDSLLSFDDEEEDSNGSTGSTYLDSDAPRYDPGDADEYDPDTTLADPITAVSDALFERYESPKKQPSEPSKIDTSKPVRASALEDDLFASYESPRKPQAAQSTPEGAQQTAKDTFSKLEFKPGSKAAGSQPAGEALSQLQAKIGGGKQQQQPTGATSHSAPVGPDDINQLDAIPTPKTGSSAASSGKTSLADLDAIPTPKTAAAATSKPSLAELNAIPTPKTGGADAAFESAKPSLAELNAIPTPKVGSAGASPRSTSSELDAIPSPKLGASPRSTSSDLDAIPTPKSGGSIPIGAAGGPAESAKGSASDTFAEGPSKLRGAFSSSTSGQVHKLGTTPGAKGRTNEALVSALSQMFEGLEIDESELASIEEQAKRAEEDKKRFQQEITEAQKANDMLSQAALAGIRNQEAQVAEKELRSELSTLRKREVSNKRYIIGGAVAAVLLGGAVVWMFMNPGRPAVTGELDAARKYMKDGLHEAARAEVKMAIAKDPKNAEAHIMYGEMLFDISEFSDAVKEFKTAEANGGKLNSEQLHQLAEAAIRTKNWNEARATTQRQLKTASTPQLLVQLGRIERDSGNWAQALEPFNKAIAGGYSAGYRERGELYFKLKQPKKAMADFDHAIKLNDKDLHAHLLRGRAFLQTGDPKSALNDFAKAQLPEKPDATVLAYQAVAFNRTGQHAKAVAAASRAIEIDRNSVPAYMARGEGYMAQRTFARAIGDFDTVLTIEPNNNEAKSKRQAAYVAYKRSSGRSYDGAQTASIPVPSNLSADSLVLKGYESLRRGDTDEAIAFLAAAVKKQPNDAMARLYLGHAFLKAGQPTRALQQFQAAQSMGGQLRPLDRVAWADALLASGQQDQAKQMFEQILQSQPKLFAARLGQLRAYLVSGDRKRAEQLAREYMVDSSEQEQEAFSSLFRSGGSSSSPGSDGGNSGGDGGGASNNNTPEPG